MCYPPFEEVRDSVVKALQCFYLNDLYLIQEGVHERTMTAHLGEYLRQFFKDWDVDCEYNRNTSEPKLIKRIPGQNVYPDVIIHKRGTKYNLLAIEAKPPHAYQDKIDEDKKKIVEYVAHKPLRYRFGLFIEFKDNFEDTCAGLQWCWLEPCWHDNGGIIIPAASGRKNK